MLTFLPVLTKDVENIPKFVIGFRYPFNNFAPTISVENKTVHVLKAILQFQNIVEVKFLVPDDHKLQKAENFESASRDWLCQLLRIKAVSFGVEDKKNFKEYYDQSLNIKKNE